MRLQESLISKSCRGAFLLYILFFLFPIQLQAQAPGRETPNLTITVDAQIVDVDVFHLADAAFNLQGIMTSQRSPVFFTLSALSDQPTPVMFGIDIVAETDVASGEVHIFSGVTRPVQLQANQPQYYSNRDLAQGGRLELYEYDIISLTGGSPDARRIVDAIRATSRLPDGIYYFTITAFIPRTTNPPYRPRDEVAHVVRQLRITNPTRVELLSPMDGEQILTPFPLFQWRSDTRAVILNVFEVQPGMQSLEEAITGIPHLQHRISNSNQFFYPQSAPGVRALEPGKRYVWFLEGIYGTSANVEEKITSELYAFTVADPQREGTHNFLLMLLEQLLGAEYANIVQELRDRNLQFQDQIFLDGTLITTAELQAVISALRAQQNNASIINVTIE